MNYRLFSAFVTFAIGIQPLVFGSDLQRHPTKEVLLPSQTGSNLPHRIRVPVESVEPPSTGKKKKKELNKKASKEKESNRSPSKPSSPPKPQPRKPEAENSEMPERFR